MIKSVALSIRTAADRVAAPYRWLLATVMIVVVAIGWKYPLLGFAVPVAMVAGIAGSFVNGRYVCGNLCPRGSFYDTFFAIVGGNRQIPDRFRSFRLRWAILALLMGFMVYRLSQDPANLNHWGTVFWQMCALTTAAGIVLGFVHRARTWCAICPVGTLSAAIGGTRGNLQISHQCRGCGLCERHCSFGLSIAEHRSSGILPHLDCLRCSTCVDNCPHNALSWPR